MDLERFLNSIPNGKVATYKDVAKSLKTSPRHAGYLLSKNNPKKAPCYKIIKSDGTLGGYSAGCGIEEKIKLLKKDGIKIINGKIDLDKYGY